MQINHLHGPAQIHCSFTADPWVFCRYTSVAITSQWKHQSWVDVHLTRFERASGKQRLMQLRYLRRKWLWKITVRGSQFLKRSTECLLALVALIALIPLFAVVAILIKSVDGGPVLFWQKRIGQHGVIFPFPKFRSMVMNAEALRVKLAQQNDHGQGITFKMKRDPRITWIGRIIRKFSIDELPQLWCVVKGDLALVGPRPAIPSEVAQYTLADRRRLEIKPGLTCIWQVSGRSEIPFDRQVALDVEYIHSQSFLVDLSILLKTIPAILTGRGAY
jgi:lipopolysaccharide/colanic/teichoic acid biosynthesis glycosyltransferase